MNIPLSPTPTHRNYRFALAALSILLLGACVKTSLLDNPTPPPEDEPIFYECIYHSIESGRSGRWRAIDPLDVFAADQAALAKCDAYSKNPGTCRRATCRWRFGEPK